MSAQPTLSVVVPTHNRRAALLRCLASLAAQTLPPEAFEVVVAADSCADGSEAAAEAFASTAPFRMLVVRHTARSAAATRNLGAAVAAGPVLVFLDDDMFAAPGLLAAHLDALRRAEVSIGYSRPALPPRPSRWQRDARRWWEDRFRAMEAPGHRFCYEDLFSGNLALSAALFARVGGFDLAFAGRLEDYELGMRLIGAGARLGFSYAAAAAHHDQSDVDTWLRRLGLDGAAHVLLARRYPELRGALFGHARGRVGRGEALARALARAAPRRGDGLLALAVGLIRLCEGLTMEGARARVLRLAREYSYWRGVAAAVGPGGLGAWLAAAQPPAVADDAPTLDLATLPDGPELERRLALGAERGLRLRYGGAAAAQVAPQPGAEPLRVAHLRRALLDAGRDAVLPGVALDILTSGAKQCWPLSPRST